MRHPINPFRYKWSCGFGSWPEKPRLAVCLDYYDGHIIAIHLWRFWIEGMER